MERVQVSLGSKPWHWVVGQFEFQQWVDAVEKSGFLLIVTVFRLRCTGCCY
jgi:hypothetical protein